jgi:4-hydroxybenzoate polyprenyltransferase
MTLRTALKLGRVSNLPTVWTNVLAGVALTSLTLQWRVVLPVAVAVSLLYVAGMYLNDAFDHRWDAEHRPERPIPAGEASARTVLRVGFGMMGAALVVLVTTVGARAFVAGLALAGVIVLYDLTHKKTRFAPLLMGLCRVGVYFTAGLAAAPTLALPLYFGAAFLLSYLILLSSIARDETKDARLPRLVGRLIAGIALVDGAQLLALWHPWLALTCLGAFVLTLRLQRRVPGT